MTKDTGDDYLEALETKSIYIIREAYHKYHNKLALLWSMGKDSTALLHLARKEYGIHLIITKNTHALNKKMSPEKGRYRCCQALKTEALKLAAKDYHLKAFLVAIRRDEHLIRAKERIFSVRDKNFKWNWRNPSLEMWTEYSDACADQSGHLRVHPLLGWREIDVWRYTKKEKLPVVNLYFSKKGKRYRSIGCKCCCQAIPSLASNIDKIIAELGATKIAERSGRCQDKEKTYMMQKLRSLGYM